MPDDQFPEPQPVDVRATIGTFLGVILIVVGAIVAVWVLVNVYRMINHPQSLEIFAQMMPEGQEWRELDIDDKKVTLPEGLFRFLGYFLGGFLLSVAAMIAGSFINGGAGLLQPAFQKLAAKIDRKMEDFGKKVAEIGKSLDNKG